MYHLMLCILRPSPRILNEARLKAGTQCIRTHNRSMCVVDDAIILSLATTSRERRGTVAQV